MAQDPELQPLWCSWAESKWPQYAPITEVAFEFGAHGPYSEWTPDVDPYVSVEIKSGGKWFYMEYDYGIAALIAEMLNHERIKDGPGKS